MASSLSFKDRQIARISSAMDDSAVDLGAADYYALARSIVFAVNPGIQKTKNSDTLIAKAVSALCRNLRSH